MSPELKEAHDTGYLYVHDLTERRIMPFNCCLFRMADVLKGGFEMANQWYNEPKRLSSAGGVIGDVILSSASQQYGGFTVSEIDRVLAPYAEKSYNKYVEESLSESKTALELAGLVWDELDETVKNKVQENAEKVAWKKVSKDMENVFQEFEYKFNTVASSRGDYPFITVTAGLSTSPFGKMSNIAMLKVRKNGQGKKENKKPVLFPKIVFLYDKTLHGEGGELRDVYEAGIECSSKTMYPDFLSLSGNGYIPSIYKKYGKVISLMGRLYCSSIKNLVNLTKGCVCYA
jgi:ribonucleoside-triphosphate reductase